MMKNQKRMGNCLHDSERLLSTVLVRAGRLVKRPVGRKARHPDCIPGREPRSGPLRTASMPTQGALSACSIPDDRRRRCIEDRGKSNLRTLLLLRKRFRWPEPWVPVAIAGWGGGTVFQGPVPHSFANRRSYQPVVESRAVMAQTGCFRHIRRDGNLRSIVCIG